MTEITIIKSPLQRAHTWGTYGPSNVTEWNIPATFTAGNASVGIMELLVSDRVLESLLYLESQNQWTKIIKNKTYVGDIPWQDKR